MVLDHGPCRRCQCRSCTGQTRTTRHNVATSYHRPRLRRSCWSHSGQTCTDRHNVAIPYHLGDRAVLPLLQLHHVPRQLRQLLLISSDLLVESFLHSQHSAALSCQHGICTTDMVAVPRTGDAPEGSTAGRRTLAVVDTHLCDCQACRSLTTRRPFVFQGGPARLLGGLRI